MFTAGPSSLFLPGEQVSIFFREEVEFPWNF
jgi:hypothetical protein